MRPIYTYRWDEIDSALLYVGKATVGSSEQAPVWRVCRLTVDGTVSKLEYANGSTGFNSAWADRASLDYS